MFTVSLFIALTIFMFILALYNLPHNLHLYDTNKENKIVVQANDKSQKDLYIRAVKSGEQKVAILEEAGNGVFYRNNPETGELETDFSIASNAQEAPELKVKAIIKIAGKVAACVDINNIAEGIIMTPGMSFLDYGKIIHINEKGIEWEWNGKTKKSEM